MHKWQTLPGKAERGTEVIRGNCKTGEADSTPTITIGSFHSFTGAHDGKTFDADAVLVSAANFFFSGLNSRGC